MIKTRSALIVFILIILTFTSFLKLQFLNRKPKYIIIVLADSLRPDHMGCYGYDKATTPFIDEKSKEALIFENAFTTGSWTPPVIPSLFTGLYVFQHRVSRFKTKKGDGNFEDSFKKKALIYEVLPEGMVTLAGMLKEYGFRTFSLYNIFGFTQDFDKYIYTHDVTFIKIFKKIFKNNKNDNLFFYLHFASPHAPYIEFHGISEEFETLNMKKIKDYPYEKNIPLPYAEEEAFNMYENIGQCMLGYDKEIFWVDRQFKQLWEFLEEEKALKNSLIIFLSDHGEEFGEHGRMHHSGYRLYDEIIHIPLIIWNFKYKKSKRIDSVVSIIDLYPTILASIGCDIKNLNSKFNFFSKNLFEINKIPKERGVIAEVPHSDAQGNFLDIGLVTYRTKDKKIYLDENEEDLSYYKIINAQEVKCEDDGEFKKEKEAFLNILKKIKYAYFKETKPNSKKSELDQQTLEHLKSLGYLQ